MTYNIKNVY